MKYFKTLHVISKDSFKFFKVVLKIYLLEKDNFNQLLISCFYFHCFDFVQHYHSWLSDKILHYQNLTSYSRIKERES